MPALSDLSIPALETLLAEHGLPRVHARKLLRHFYDTAGLAPVAIEIPKRLRELINEKLPLRQSRILTQRTSADGTTKLLVGFNHDATLPQLGNSRESAECVLMPSHRDDRTAGCISSQIGCAMGCDFCASTRDGLLRNLTAGEIVEQFLWLRRLSLDAGRRLVTLVFMGMGEPLLNYDNVVEAIKRIAGQDLGALGWRQVTISTVGIIPGIDRLAGEGLPVQLALSLHAPDDATRAAIVPAGRRYNVAEILAAADRYQTALGRPVNIEYCLLQGVNDSDDQARMLADLLKDRRMHINLIPYNAIGRGVSGRVYQRPGESQMIRFAQILKERGAVAHFRQPRGQDIEGACGQLKNSAEP